VRTYVTVDGKPGIFSSVSTPQTACVVAHGHLPLPYFHARMTLEREAGAVRYASERIDQQRPAPAEFRGRYGHRTGLPAAAGTLEHCSPSATASYTLDDACACSARRSPPSVALAAGAGGDRDEHDG